MKITWTPNPLRSIVELDDADRWWLREAMQEDHGAQVNTAWLNEAHASYEAALRDTHDGDCLCIPSSCLKCQAEGYLGINTTPGLGKHLASKINFAFGEAFSSDRERTLDEAIAVLSHYNPEPTSPMWDGRHDLWDACLPRWMEEAGRALAWLVGYRTLHFHLRF